MKWRSGGGGVGGGGGGVVFLCPAVSAHPKKYTFVATVHHGNNYKNGVRETRTGCAVVVVAVAVINARSAESHAGATRVRVRRDVERHVRAAATNPTGGRRKKTVLAAVGRFTAVNAAARVTNENVTRDARFSNAFRAAFSRPRYDTAGRGAYGDPRTAPSASAHVCESSPPPRVRFSRAAATRVAFEKRLAPRAPARVGRNAGQPCASCFSTC
ncbi:Hypothetical protein CINCED_3A000983 [Cinara cedri]|uniref:Uncharacterized protein n=1 Tax=Cinara cedri TaxID=506608 RepID=A0A5E4MDX9_9HEMI|nr:Hypothetical protein CINCED_3A000983 [Cinara cedri]